MGTILRIVGGFSKNCWKEYIKNVIDLSTSLTSTSVQLEAASQLVHLHTDCMYTNKHTCICTHTCTHTICTTSYEHTHTCTHTYVKQKAKPVAAVFMVMPTQINRNICAPHRNSKSVQTNSSGGSTSALQEDWQCLMDDAVLQSHLDITHLTEADSVYFGAVRR